MSLRNDPSAADTMDMQRSMLVCCGMMTVVIGAIALSSVAAMFGLTTGLTYLIIGGFVGISASIMAYLYGVSTRSPTRA